MLIYSPRETPLAEECRSCAILAAFCCSTGRNVDARKNIGRGASADEHDAKVPTNSATSLGAIRSHIVDLH